MNGRIIDDPRHGGNRRSDRRSHVLHTHARAWRRGIRHPEGLDRPSREHDGRQEGHSGGGRGVRQGLRKELRWPLGGVQLRGLRGGRACGVIDRNISIGSGGVVFNELRSALYDVDDKPAFLGFHTGLSGEEVTPGMVRKIAEKTLEAARGRVKPLVEWV